MVGDPACVAKLVRFCLPTDRLDLPSPWCYQSASLQHPKRQPAAPPPSFSQQSQRPPPPFHVEDVPYVGGAFGPGGADARMAYRSGIKYLAHNE